MMALVAASFQSGLFASPVLFGLFCWPFLAVWVLWAARNPARAGYMARLGLGVGALALLGCSSGLSWGQGLCLAMACCVPALIFTLRGDPAPMKGEAGEAVTLAKGMAAWLPLLVTGCIFLGFLLRSPLAALFCDGAGTVLLAWWDGRATRRAMPAWEMVRLRLGGLILAGLGLMTMQGGAVFASNGAALQLGAVLALVGLCMMAGLGSALSSRAELALLDVGLRFVPLCLVPLAVVSPFMQWLVILAGLLALAGTAFTGLMPEKRTGRAGRVPLLSWMTGLGLLAAGTGQMVALLLLYAAALLSAALRLGCGRPAIRRAVEGRPGVEPGLVALPADLALPVIMVVLVVLVPLLGRGERIGLLLCILPGFRHLRLASLPASLLLLWQKGGMLVRGLLLLSAGLALLAVGLLDMGLMPGQAVLPALKNP